MRIGILSDIHSNDQALRSVLAEADDRVQSYWSLGDAIGYGPRPIECLEFLRDRIARSDWVMGNHDAGLAGALPVDEHKGFFNSVASMALFTNIGAIAQDGAVGSWARQAFQATRLRPRVRRLRGMTFVLVHGSLSADGPTGPARSGRNAAMRAQIEAGWTEYAMPYLHPWNEAMISREFEFLRRRFQTRLEPICLLYGHTHIPVLFTAGRERGAPVQHHEIQYGKPMPLGDALTILNPGSVGQPRDLDSRASFAILNPTERTVEFRRVAYLFKPVQHDMQQHQYPQKLIRGLSTAELHSGCSQAEYPYWWDYFHRRAMQNTEASPSGREQTYG